MQSHALVDHPGDFAICASEPACIDQDAGLAGFLGLKHPVRLGPKLPDIRSKQLQRIIDERAFAAELLQRGIVISFGEFRHTSHGLCIRLDMAA